MKKEISQQQKNLFGKTMLSFLCNIHLKFGVGEIYSPTPDSGEEADKLSRILAITTLIKKKIPFGNCRD